MRPKHIVSAAFALTVVGAPGAARGETSDEPVDSPTPAFFDVNKYRADPGNPGAIHVPGTNVALYIGGFAQLDYISDIQVIGNPDQFVVSSVPVGGGTGNTGSELTVRQTRVFLETDAPWAVAPLLAYVEVDFFDPQNNSNLHIRHAFGAVGHPDGVRLVAGYTWTSFMDATVIPSQLDYAGPVGLANVQQAQARLVVPFLQTRGPNGEHRGLEWTTLRRRTRSPDHDPDERPGDRLCALARHRRGPEVEPRPRPPPGERVVSSGRDLPVDRPTRGRDRLWRQLHGRPGSLLGEGPGPLGGGRRPRDGPLLRGLERALARRVLAARRRPVPDQRRRRTAVVPALLRGSVRGERDRKRPSPVQSRGGHRTRRSSSSRISGAFASFSRTAGSCSASNTCTGGAKTGTGTPAPTIACKRRRRSGSRF